MRLGEGKSYDNGKQKFGNRRSIKRYLIGFCCCLISVYLLRHVYFWTSRQKFGETVTDSVSEGRRTSLSYSKLTSLQEVVKRNVRGSAVLNHLKQIERERLDSLNFRMKKLEKSMLQYSKDSKSMKNTLVNLSKKLESVLHPDPRKPLIGEDEKSSRSSFSNRQLEVIEEFKYSWKAYKDYGYGQDEVLPVSKTWNKWFNLGLTLVDSLDTLWLMGLNQEFDEARAWVKSNLRLDQNVDVNLFECTIRELGGLLATYFLSHDDLFLEKARELGERLLPAFNSKSGIPYSDVNLHTHKAHAPKWGRDSSLAEVTTIQLEFEYLSALTGDKKFKEVVEKVNEIIALKAERTTIPHLLPIFINADTAEPSRTARVSLGARGDSYYEYLLKQWLLTGKQDERMRQRYMAALIAIENKLLKYSKPNNYAFFAELESAGGGGVINKMDHLVCFMPGLIALGAANGANSVYGRGGVDVPRMKLAKDLLETCLQMYEQQVTGLSPEIVFFHTDDGHDKDMQVKPADAHNLLRPETIESLFVMYRLSKDESYRDRGHAIFLNFKKHCRVGTGGYTSIKSVLSVPVVFRDKMESFWLAETLKYFFLLFSDDPGLLDLNKVVFNTEAHPFPQLKVGLI